MDGEDARHCQTVALAGVSPFSVSLQFSIHDRTTSTRIRHPLSRR